MASLSASLSQPSQLEDHLKCSICFKVFDDPVTTVCGHSFCMNCLVGNQKHSGGTCPLCKKHLNVVPDVNIVLREVVQQLKQTQTEDDPEKYTGAWGEVPCDVCTEEKLKAKKSCLVCLVSYCSAHLYFHLSAERLKGHKLVEPVRNLDSRACLNHGRPLELFSRNQQKCVCVRCLEEGQHEAVSTETEWKEKMVKLGNTKDELQQKIDERKSKVDEINTALKSCKDRLDNDWWDIEAVLNAVLAIVEEVQAVLLQPLEDRKKVLEKEAEYLKSKLEAEIKNLDTMICELDDISVLEDHVLFLQLYPPRQDTVCFKDFKDWTQVALDTSLCFGTMRKTTTKMMEKIREELEKLTAFELERISVFTEDVQLDPMSAHRRLVVSKDGKAVIDGGQDQNVADSPKRFDLLGSILSHQSLSSGRAYWEVEVCNKTGWDLGVARGDANRRGKPRVSPDNGYWVVAQYEDDKYAALTAPPLRLHLEEKPEKVGVFVDYEEGLVSFYNLTAHSHIYSFTECTFKGELYSYFGPHVKQGDRNLEPLIISVI
ncbi:E3 ubiquitin-protein ligase TRIM21-like [Salarias fasciatus]|uniref:E3 ubiquitin-protein ligase TRIM21-like n=1 Tax=Salarias fasciatus TaxID=181472 RepID=A0A672H0C1_SALFA|nr:E3 ubiquitin-protein ligase TRIM21-like [Salarias fasciatus]